MRDLIHKYLDNQCTPEEADRVLAYLRTPPGQAHLEEVFLREAGDATASPPAGSEPDYDELLRKIRSSLGEGVLSASRAVPFYRKWYAVAAAVGTLVVSAWLLFFRPSPPDVYRTAYGETRVLRLVDGSTVTLNANSVLEVSTDPRVREVWLEGEAFFEVEEVPLEEETQPHGELKKFTVHARQLDVVVVGTSFNVRNRDDGPRVVLNSGKVWLESAQTGKLVMEPGEVAEMTSRGEVVKKSTPDPADYSAWRENRLVCRNTTLEEIAGVIQNRFGYACAFADSSVRQLAVTGTLPLHELPLLNEALRESLDITVAISGQTLVFSKKK